MTPTEKLEEFQKYFNSPGGLQQFVAYVVISLFTDPNITYKTVKDVNEMTNKVIFFDKENAIFELNIPWQDKSILTDKYKWLLEIK